MNYNSRIDIRGWLSLFFTVVILALPNFVFNFSWVYFIIMLILDIFVIVFKLTTRYILKETELVVVSGPIKFSIAYDRILKITKTISHFSASCNTADKCIELKYGAHLYNSKSIKISPEKEEDFLTRLILKCNKSVEITDKRN